MSKTSKGKPQTGTGRPDLSGLGGTATPGVYGNTNQPDPIATNALAGINNQVDPLATRATLPPTPRLTMPMGVPGHVVTGGYVQTRERDPELIGYRKYQTHQNNLANIAIVGASVRYFLDLVAGGGKWDFEPADDSAEAKKFADLASDALLHAMDETPWISIVKKVATFRFHGFSVAEWTACPRDDGLIGFDSIEHRPQVTIEKWQVDPRGCVIGAWQRNPANGQWLYMDRSRLLYLVDDTLDATPEGMGLFRHIVRGGDGIRRFEELEHHGYEQDLRGVPVGWAPLAELQKQVDDGVITKEAAAAAREVMRSFIENHIRGPKNGLMLDSAPYITQDEKQTPTAQKQWQIDLLKGGATSHESIGKAIRRKTFEIARVLGTEALLLGEDGSGSLALADQAKERLYHMVNSTRAEMAHAINSQLIGPLAEMNYIPKALRPKTAPEKVERRTIEGVVNALVGMAQAGATLMPGDPAVNEVRASLGLSPVDESLAALDALLQQTGGTTAADQMPAPGEDNTVPDDETIPAPAAMKKAYADLRAALAAYPESSHF